MNLTLVTLNVWNEPDTRAAEREPLILDDLRRLDADVVCLQEMELAPTQAERWAGDLGYHATHLANPIAAGGIKSLVILSRQLPDDVDHLDLPYHDKALRTSFAGYDVITTHFIFEASRQGSAKRAEQAETLIGWLPDVPPTIVAGDLNSRRDGPALSVLHTRLRAAGAVEWTCPTPASPFFTQYEGAQAQIDHILVSNSVDVVEFGTAFDRPRGDLWPSDHLGLVARLSW